MSGVLLDTNVVSALMHRHERALQRLEDREPGDVFLCSPVSAEIRFGLERLPHSRRRRNLESEYRRVREAVSWSDWTEAAAERFGSCKAVLEREGRVLEDMDIAIGSLALSLGLSVATRNLRHFVRLEGLDVEDWSAGR